MHASVGSDRKMSPRGHLILRRCFGSGSEAGQRRQQNRITRLQRRIGFRRRRRWELLAKRGMRKERRETRDKKRERERADPPFRRIISLSPLKNTCEQWRLRHAQQWITYDNEEQPRACSILPLPSLPPINDSRPFLPYPLFPFPTSRRSIQ